MQRGALDATAKLRRRRSSDDGSSLLQGTIAETDFLLLQKPATTTLNYDVVVVFTASWRNP